MTDQQITDLLQAEADRVTVPPAPTSAVLADGRRLRRRGRLVKGGAIAAGVAGIAAVAATALVLPRAGAPDEFGPLASAVTPDPAGWAVAQGSTVHLGSGETVEVPGKVKAMYYTSAGVMVRTGRTAYTEGDSTSNYFVLEGDGDVRDFSLDLGDKKPGTDPSLPYLAYSVTAGSGWELVLRDVRTGEVATRVPYEGDFTWGGWNAPPTALSGDYAYVGVDDATLRINWRTGDVEESDVLPPRRMPTVSGGRELIDPLAEVDVDKMEQDELTELRFERPQEFRVVDAESGNTLRTVVVDPEGWPRLSPDGRFVAVPPIGMCDANTDVCSYEDPEAHVISIDSGADRSFRLEYGAHGWSPDGRLLLVNDTEVRSCDADTGACVRTAVKLDGTGPLRVSGNDNES